MRMKLLKSVVYQDNMVRKRILFLIICLVFMTLLLVPVNIFAEENLPSIETSVIAGDNFTVGLKNDGTVIAIGDKDFSELKEWRNIKEIAVYNELIVGLRQDGTVVASKPYKGEDIYTWKNIVQVATNGYFVAGLKSDGTVVMTKGGVPWNNIKKIDGVFIYKCNGFIGTKDDKTLLICDCTNGIEGTAEFFSQFTEIEKIVSSYDMIVGLKSDGTVIAYHHMWKNVDVAPWTDIKDVGIDDKGNIFGVKSDGSVVVSCFYLGSFKESDIDVTSWNDIVAISAGKNHVVAMREDGKIFAAGDNTYGQCDVSGWNLTPLLGDANDDGSINAEDALAILKCSAKVEAFGKEYLPGKWSFSNAKVTDVKPEMVTAEDALKILKYAAGIIKDFN